MNTEEKNDNQNQEQTTAEVKIDPWHELQNGFKGIRLLKNPIRLKEIRDLAHKLKTDFNKQVVSLDNQQKQMSDELDQFTAQHKIKELKGRISTIDEYLGEIQKRVRTLISENKASAKH